MTSAPAAKTDDVLARLKAASSAEDFFSILELPYDEAVVRVARLHILKRMGQYLAVESFAGLPLDVVADQCRANLKRAYEDFVTSKPIEQRVFKVLREAVEPKPAAPPAIAFVPLETLLK
jgi:nitrogenase-stabilizing/protective protein